MSDPIANLAALHQQAIQAYITNQNFVNIAGGATYPLDVNEQTILVNQTVFLTQVVNALLRIVFNDLVDISDT